MVKKLKWGSVGTQQGLPPRERPGGKFPLPLPLPLPLTIAATFLPLPPTIGSPQQGMNIRISPFCKLPNLISKNQFKHSNNNVSPPNFPFYNLFTSIGFIIQSISFTSTLFTGFELWNPFPLRICILSDYQCTNRKLI